MEAVSFTKVMLNVAERHVEPALQHQDELVGLRRRLAVERDARTGGKRDIDEIEPPVAARRRDAAPDIAALRVAPGRLLVAAGHRRQGGLRPGEKPGEG